MLAGKIQQIIKSIVLILLCFSYEQVLLADIKISEGGVSSVIRFEEIKTSHKSTEKGPGGEYKETIVITRRVVIVGEKIVVNLKRHEQKILKNGLKVTFKGHSHKKTLSGQKSPLIVVMEIEYKGMKSVETFSIFPQREDSVYWIWKGFVFIHLDSQYGKYEKFEVSMERGKT